MRNLLFRDQEGRFPINVRERVESTLHLIKQRFDINDVYTHDDVQRKSIYASLGEQIGRT